MYVFIHIYVYILTHIYTYIYAYIYAYTYEKENARQHASMSWKMRAPGFTFRVANAQSVLEMPNVSNSPDIASNSSEFVLLSL
jgi:hypothetical protein